MVPHGWMIEELERMRREREDAPRGPIVIEY